MRRALARDLRFDAPGPVMAFLGGRYGRQILDGVGGVDGMEQAPRDQERDHLSRCIARETADKPPVQDAASVSLEAEVPEALFVGMRDFIQAHPHWDQYRVMTSALAGFLFQNGCTDRNVAQHYLHGLFRRQGQP